MWTASGQQGVLSGSYRVTGWASWMPLIWWIVASSVGGIGSSRLSTITASTLDTTSSTVPQISTPNSRIAAVLAAMLSRLNGMSALGTGTAGMGGDINKLKPVSTLTVGTASKDLGDTLQLDVYAAQGSSGSPVFNTQGIVVGVLFGAPAESNGRIIYAVPSSKVAAQMPGEGAGVVK